MTEREIKRLNALLAKKEAEEKAEKEFFQQVKKRKDEVGKFLGFADIQNKLERIAKKYGTDINGLLEHIDTEQQINFYRRRHLTTMQNGVI